MAASGANHAAHGVVLADSVLLLAFSGGLLAGALFLLNIHDGLRSEVLLDIME